MKRLGQKICVAVALSLAFVAIWHDSAQAAMPVIAPLGQIKDNTVVNPTRIDVDAAGTIYLCDGNVNGVTRYNKYGQSLPTLKGAYTVKSNGVAVTPDGSRVFVSVAEPGKMGATAVAVLNGSTGELLGYLGAGFNEFKRVVEIDLDGAGNIYVGNYDKAKTTTNLVNTAEVDVYDGVTYAKLYSFGKPATSLVNGYYLPLAGEFGEIAGLTVDVVKQEVLVAEGWNNNGISRVQVFALNGTLKSVLPEASFSGTQYNCKPVGLSVDPSGRVYMLSILTNTIHAFTTNPVAYLGKFTKGTPDPAYDASGKVYPWTVGMIPTPSFDTVYDPATGRLFVVTDGNGIQIFSVDGSTNPLKTNRAPATPVMLSPIQSGEVATLTPTLQWAAALDEDNDVLSYNVKILALNGTTVSSKNNVAATSLSVAAGTLLENNNYSWQVQAADAELTSVYSVSENFWVNAVEEAPTAAQLVGPAPAATVNKDTVFRWQAATDVDPFDTVTYRLEIAKSTDFAAPVITVKQSGLTSAALSTLPDYASLRAGETYLWRVVTVDSTGLTTASEYRSFDCNSAPETPALISPVQGSEIVTLTPTLQWSALDADGDTLTYSVQILMADGTTVSTNTDVAPQNLAVAAGTLLENNKYGWRVQAADAELTSSYSAVENFWVNAVEEAPTAAHLLAPVPAATVNKGTVFSWQAATDVDPFDTVSYRLEIAKSTDFAAPVITVNQSGLTSVALSSLPGYAALRAGETYLWRVVAVDSTGLTTASEYRSFDCNSVPEIPSMISPIKGGEVATLTPTLQWTAAVDADGDTLSYNVQVVDADGKALSINDNIAALSLSVTADTLHENGKYGWQVQSADFELTSAYSTVENFWVNAVEEAPTAALLSAPAAAATADKDTVFSWQAATDVDPFAIVTYRLEIAKDEDFAAPVITVELEETSSAALSTLSGYANLQPNATYQWRVVAVDNTGLSTASAVRSFDYATTILAVDATFPGAKVYIGGNSAYSGRYVGEVPVQLRDITPGTIEIVVERAGFEPWIKNVVVQERQSVAVNAALVVAVLPGEFKKKGLEAGGVKIQGGAEAAPVLVDFDNDGLDDLLVADGSGKLLLYKGVAGAEWSLAPGAQLPGVALPVGAVPFVADWNNDNRQDLLVGAADGSVSLYLNSGTQAAPIFAAATQLQADHAPLNVVSNAAPLLFDLNDDGAKDLLVGSGDGSLYKFLNIGSDADPLFAAREVLITAASDVATNASALVADWDADGSKEILLAADNQAIALYERQDDGSYGSKGVPLLVKKSGTEEMLASSFGEKIRMVAANTDGVHGKDLLIGNAAGEILMAYSSTSSVSEISPFFDEALLETIAEIEAQIPSNMKSALSQVRQSKKDIQVQAVNKQSYYDKVKKTVVSLQSALKSDAEVTALLGKLLVQLNSEIPLN